MLLKGGVLTGRCHVQLRKVPDLMPDGRILMSVDIIDKDTYSLRMNVNGISAVDKVMRSGQIIRLAFEDVDNGGEPLQALYAAVKQEEG